MQAASLPVEIEQQRQHKHTIAKSDEENLNGQKLPSQVFLQWLRRSSSHFHPF